MWNNYLSFKTKRNTLSSVKRVGGIKGQGLAIVWGRSWDNCYKEIHQSGGKIGEGDRMVGGKGGSWTYLLYDRGIMKCQPWLN